MHRLQPWRVEFRDSVEYESSQFYLVQKIDEIKATMYRKTWMPLPQWRWRFLETSKYPSTKLTRILFFAAEEHVLLQKCDDTQYLT